MNFLFGDTFRIDKDYKHDFKTGRWVKTEHDNRVEEHHKLHIGGYIVKLEKDEGLDDDKTSKINRMP